VKTTDTHSGAVTFYQAERVWGHHDTFRVVLEQEAGRTQLSLQFNPRHD
jgi:hypothetical protein